MANPPRSLLAGLVQSSELRRLRRVEFSRAVTAAVRTAKKREVRRAKREMIAAQESYSACVCEVLVKSCVYVHNMDELEALMEMLEGAAPPYSLRRVTVRSPDPDVAEQVRESLEAGGFKLWAGNDTYVLPRPTA